MNIMIVTKSAQLSQNFRTLTKSFKVTVEHDYSNAVSKLLTNKYDLSVFVTPEDSTPNEWDLEEIQKCTNGPSICITGTTEISEELLFSLMNSVKNTQSTQIDHTLFQASLKFIEENLYNEELSLEKAASQAFISKCHYSRLFKKYLGIGYKEYIINKRIMRAKVLLDRGETVTDTCFAVGYNDLTHFGRVFKKIVGVNPSIYRDKNQLEETA